MNHPTEKQDAILRFIEKYATKFSLSPTYKEIQDHFGFGSLNSVQNHVNALVKKGLLRGVIDKRGRRKMLVSIRTTGSPANTKVPLIGTIAAGMPIEAVENIQEELDLFSIGIDNSDKDFFALNVQGDSMVNAHILSGDMVVIKKQQQVSSHEIAAVLLNNDATLKYVKKTARGFFLVPANDTMEPIAVDPRTTSAFAILGKVVRVIRRC
ncbi:MAG: transcriptional repressor LexA [Chitinispirillaceae bacterium]|nr:transcriptional repressor LexA [Chitinispirillaceae bacterium]